MAVLPSALSSARSRLARAARWLAPSIAAACAGALAAGVAEAAPLAGAFARAATIGFVVLFAAPALLVACAGVRAIVGAWQPGDLARNLREDGGGMPRLAGWVLTLQLGALLLAWTTFQGTWQLAAWTAFKPLTVGFAQPVIAVGTVLLVASASRPAAALFAALARRIDARWRRGHRPTLLSPTIIVLGAAITSSLVGYVLWRKVVRPRTGALAIGFLYAPLVGIAMTVFVHGVWAQLARTRVVLGGVLGALALAAAMIALVMVTSQPAPTLAIWGERSLAGFAIDTLFDLDRIRDDLPAAALRPPARAAAAHPDIVLVTIATVRADRTPPYGGTAEMPVLRDLAVRGAVFNWAFAASTTTWRSLPSIALGTSPQRVRERAAGTALRLDPRHVLLAERLRAGGYETAGFMCCAELWGAASRTGLHRGFAHLEIDADGRALARAAQRWLAGQTEHAGARPLFAWMHVDAPPPSPTRAGPVDAAERTRHHDAELAAADHQLGMVIAELANRPRPAIVIVTAAHGAPLGDHGQPLPGTDLYNPQLRVPLVILGPGIKPQRIQETVSLTDLAPTVLDLAGFDALPPPTFDGDSFAALASGERLSAIEGGTAFAALIKDRLHPGGLTAVVRGRWKLIVNGTLYELYDLHADPDERSNQATVRPEIVVQLRQLLEPK